LISFLPESWEKVTSVRPSKVFWTTGLSVSPKKPQWNPSPDFSTLSKLLQQLRFNTLYHPKINPKINLLNFRHCGLCGIHSNYCNNFNTLYHPKRTFTSSTWAFSSTCFPFWAKKFWVKTSKMSAQNTQLCVTSPFSRFVNLTIGMSWN